MINHVKIAGLTYKVRLAQLDELEMGGISYKQGIIRIDNTMSLPTQKLTLLHEISHALLYGFTESTESQATTLSLLLRELIRDNPLLIEYIQKEEDGNETEHHWVTDTLMEEKKIWEGIS